MEEKKTNVILILQTEIEHFANGAPPHPLKKRKVQIISTVHGTLP